MKASVRGGLVEYFRTFRNEQLKESRLFLWEALGGKETIAIRRLEECSGNKVAGLFHQWLKENPESLRVKALSLSN